MFPACHDSRAAIFAITFGLACPAAGVAQELDLSITDPDEIAAICGGDPNVGAPIYATACAACHSVAPGDGHAEGPNLHAVFGRAPGTAEGYDYSDALVAAGEAGMIWERETLHAYLSDPTGHLPGTIKGADTAITDDTARTHLMTWLRVTTTPPPPRPEDVEVPAALLSMEGDPAYGEYLWGECAGCHVTGAPGSGVSQMAPGLTRDGFVRALVEYGARARPNQSMQIVANRLGDAEIAALAAYFETVR